MPPKELELIDNFERPEEAEPEPDGTPDVDIDTVEDFDDSMNLNFNFKAKDKEFLLMDLIFPIFQVPPNIPGELERGIEGCAIEYTVTPLGSVSEPVVIQANPPGIFDRAALELR